MGKDNKNNKNEGPAVKPADDLVAVNTKKKEDLRKKHNSDILNKMKGGDPLTSFNSMDSWFPPRPKIEKIRILWVSSIAIAQRSPSTMPNKSVNTPDLEASDKPADDRQQNLIGKLQKVNPTRPV